ncbi:MAG: hypothetical protein IPI81_10005 [Flavobacteriales bacterium]|nr:hypothetical protein [Flavobacteriales bacterium]MCC6936794.1 hypothetical protein [Flavobacteriales bacterium]
MGLIDTMMISCRKASELTERKELVPLNAVERAGLWFHLRICDGCKAYVKQSAALDRWLDERRDGNAVVDSGALEDRILNETGTQG